MKINTKKDRRARIRFRMKNRAVGSTRPRLAVFRSEAHIYAQVIDDAAGVTLVSASTAEPSVKAKLTDGARGANIKGAQTVGTVVAERLKDKGITKVVFDRGGFLYHGRVKAVADAARAAGLEF